MCDKIKYKEYDSFIFTEKKRIDFFQKYNKIKEKYKDLHTSIQKMEINTNTFVVYDMLDMIECNIEDIQKIVLKNLKEKKC